jgi:hypothetical protein
LNSTITLYCPISKLEGVKDIFENGHSNLLSSAGTNPQNAPAQPVWNAH